MSANQSMAESGCYRPQFDFLIYYTSYFGACSVLGIILNSLTIAVITTGQKMGKEIRTQLTSLAVVDITAAAFYAPYMISAFLDYEYPFAKDYTCKIVLYIAYSAVLVSLISNGVISIERCIMVYFPLKSRFYTNKLKIAVVVSVWVAGFLAEIEVLFGGAVCSSGSCQVKPPKWVYLSSKYENVYYWTFSLRYIIAASVVIISYTLIGIKICLRARVGEQSNNTVQESRAEVQRNKILKMLAINSGVTLLTWLPSGLAFGITVALFQNQSLEASMHLHLFCQASFTTSHFTSPIIYFAVNQSFREDTKALAKRLCRLSTRDKHPINQGSRAYALSSVTVSTDISVSHQ